MLVSLIISAYNEENGIKSFFVETLKHIQIKGYEFQFVFVDDGSIDNTVNIIRDIKKEYENTPYIKEIKLIHLSRNFGHEAAMLAGLDVASGDYLVFMDADLQHPPEKIADIMTSFENKSNIVMMKRVENKGAGVFKNLTSKMFYAILNGCSNTKFEANASDFFAVDARVANFLRENYREKVRFLRGIIQNIGFNVAKIEYVASERVAGHSHYNFRNLLRLSMNSIFSFSNLPLKLGGLAGGISVMLGIILLVYTLCTGDGAPSGYSTIVITLCFMFSILFFIVGVIGEYIGILFTEIKGRPIYIIKEIE